jgi:hypothetical protein
LFGRVRPAADAAFALVAACHRPSTPELSGLAMPGDGQALLGNSADQFLNNTARVYGPLNVSQVEGQFVFVLELDCPEFRQT